MSINSIHHYRETYIPTINNPKSNINQSMRPSNHSKKISKIRFSVFHKVTKPLIILKKAPLLEKRHSNRKPPRRPRKTFHKTLESNSKNTNFRRDKPKCLSFFRKKKVSLSKSILAKNKKIPRRSKFTNFRESMFGKVKTSLKGVDWFKKQKSSNRSFEKDLVMIKYMRKKLKKEIVQKRKSKDNHISKNDRKERLYCRSIEVRNRGWSFVCNGQNRKKKKSKLVKINKTEPNNLMPEVTEKDCLQISNIEVVKCPPIFRKNFKGVNSIHSLFDSFKIFQFTNSYKIFKAIDRNNRKTVFLKIFKLESFAKQSQINRFMVKTSHFNRLFNKKERSHTLVRT